MHISVAALPLDSLRYAFSSLLDRLYYMVQLVCVLRNGLHNISRTK